MDIIDESLTTLTNEELMEILVSLEAIDSTLASEQTIKGDINNNEIKK